jgi:hypothetical protein
MRFTQEAVSKVLDQAEAFFTEHRATLGEVPALKLVREIRDDLRAEHMAPVSLVATARLSVLPVDEMGKFAGRPELIRDWRARVRIPRKPGMPIGTERPAARLAAEGGELKSA